MRITRKFLRGQSFALLLCLLISSMAWAQANDSNPNKTDSGAAAQNPPAAADKNARPPDNNAGDQGYIIGPDDVLAINVWKEPEISRAVPVRSDGRISLPLVGEVQAAGRTPHELKEEITKKLENYISSPEVTVIVQDIRSKKFNVLGQVMRPGAYLLTNSTTVLDAIALAGGFRDFAKQKNIYVLRKNADGTETRLPFNYKDVIKGKNMEQNIKLQPRDTIVVP